MWTARTVVGLNGLPKVHLSNSISKSSTDIYFFGATLTSWVDKNGTENIFVSSAALFNGVKAIRGGRKHITSNSRLRAKVCINLDIQFLGIPVVFPQFGQPLKSMPQHGFARTSQWTLESSSSEEGSVTVTFSLTDSDASFALWPHRFKLEYTVMLADEYLSCSLKVRNTDYSGFAVHTLLHTYLKVPSIKDVTVKGFKNRSFVDKVDDSKVGHDTRDIATIDGEVDRVMTGDRDSALSVTMETGTGPDHKCVTVGAKAILTDHETGENTVYPHDVVFWNPWIEKAKALADLGDEDYTGFLCLEPGTTSEWVAVKPNDSLTLTQVLTSSR